MATTSGKTTNCSATVFGPRVQHWPCSRRGIVERKGRWYCHQHDPEVMKAKREKQDAAWTAKAHAQDAICNEATALAARLGVDGGADYWNGAYVRNLVISFEDAEKLADRMNAASRRVTRRKQAGA